MRSGRWSSGPAVLSKSQQNTDRSMKNIRRGMWILQQWADLLPSRSQSEEETELSEEWSHLFDISRYRKNQILHFCSVFLPSRKETSFPDTNNASNPRPAGSEEPRRPPIVTIDKAEPAKGKGGGSQYPNIPNQCGKWETENVRGSRPRGGDVNPPAATGYLVYKQGTGKTSVPA